MLHGYDISDAASFICKIQEQNISFYLYEIHENEILYNSYDAKLKPNTGTYKIHQIKTQKLGELWYRDVSCLCEEEEIHPGLEWTFVKIAENNQAREPAEIARPQKRRIECQTKLQRIKSEEQIRKPKQIYILRRNVKEAMKVQYQKVIKA